MRKIITFILLSLIAVSLIACEKKKETELKDSKSTGDKTIKVATSMLYEPVLKAAKPEVEKLGYKLDIVVFNDFVLPNTSLQEGSVDVNFYQHEPYLNNFNKEQGTNLVRYGDKLLGTPFAIYSNKIKNIDELKRGAKVSLASDATNRARALRFLEEEGIIKLNDKVDIPTKLDIVENKKELEFIEMEQFNLPSSLEDVDISAMSAIAMENATGKGKEAVLFETGVGVEEYAIILAVKEGMDTTPAEILEKAIKSDTVKKFLEKEYRGVWAPLF